MIKQRIDTPLGEMIAIASDTALILLEFSDQRYIDEHIAKLGGDIHEGENDITRLISVELDAYFKGELRDFKTPLDMDGTDFQRCVWESLTRIPYAQTHSYGEQANDLGKPRAVRAVASANGANRLAIIVPCHRVIGKNGALSGYAGGLERKEKLLELERRCAA